MLVGLLVLLAACGKPPVEIGIQDPNEARNRVVFEMNKDVDRRILRPASKGYGSALPEPVQRSIGNFAGNVDLPSSVVNDILQANIDDAAHNFTRFLINTTFGILGIFDPATSFGLPERKSDFGETLAVWGFREGNYVVLPVVGPSTQRDAVGRVVGLFTNPLTYALPSPEKYVGPVARVASKVGDRYRFASTIDSILYESADAYTQARLLYLDNRRFQLSGAAADEYIDPYEDPYAE
jgi:phospholipid-binding lipoprotein MlaA